MARQLSKLVQRYQAALREHLKRGPRSSSAAAARLGRQAVAGGLGTLDVVRMHESALAGLALPSDSGRTRATRIKRAASFFAEVIIPIEQTHRAALQEKTQVKRLLKSVGRRTVDLTESHRQLKQNIARRKTAEKALHQSGQHHAKLLAESQRLQAHLRSLAHQILSLQEDKRQRISRQLHDEIAQILLGISVRLLTLKATAGGNTQRLQKEIASTERLVEDSTKTMRQFAREFGSH